MKFKDQDLRTKYLTLKSCLDEKEDCISWNVYITKSNTHIGCITLYSDGGVVPDTSGYLAEIYEAVSDYAKKYNLQPKIQIF
jgi:hypothetical protein